MAGAPDLTDAEWKVMHALWRAQPATAREVLDAIRPRSEWAYTTVKSLLARLEEKRAVRSTARGNTNVYESLVTRERAQRSALGTLLTRAFDGAAGALALQLLGDERLSTADRVRLREMIEAEEPRKRGRDA